MYILPESLRDELKKPLGKILNEDEMFEEIKNKKVTAVGDVVTLTMYEKGITPDLGIVDFKSMRTTTGKLRKKISGMEGKVIKVNNPPGTITDEIWKAIREAYNTDEKTRIEVNGEEDLSALACIFLAPINSIVVYGMPGKGIAAVNVTKEKKQLVGSVLKKMGEKHGS